MNAVNPGSSDLSPLTSGWNIEEEEYAIHWFDGEQSPSSIELTLSGQGYLGCSGRGSAAQTHSL